MTTALTATSRITTVSPTVPPPLGGMGGSIHGWERGRDPFARECMPEQFQDRFPDEPARAGWLALDWCGNVISWCADGTVIGEGGA